jgi:hypothetical protein
MSENECVEKPALKLFVVGELSKDPSEWDALCSKTLVFAENAAQAKDLAENSCRAVTEVVPVRPCVLVRLEVYT